MNVGVETDKQVLLHKLSPEMFVEVAPASQLYENNEADAQKTRHVAKELRHEQFSEVIAYKNLEKVRC